MENQKSLIGENQEFKIQIVNSMGLCREEFTGIGTVEYERILQYAKRIAFLLKGCKIYITLKSKATLQP